ncbi:MAG: hypothetical protein L6R39_005363 [Caloplaca ligustica]|nr:MAG: hypothetical protein L6R39_005363 [Caloplaca ligustica]
MEMELRYPAAIGAFRQDEEINWHFPSLQLSAHGNLTLYTNGRDSIVLVGTPFPYPSLSYQRWLHHQSVLGRCADLRTPTPSSATSSLSPPNEHETGFRPSDTNRSLDTAIKRSHAYISSSSSVKQGSENEGQPAGVSGAGYFLRGDCPGLPQSTMPGER